MDFLQHVTHLDLRDNKLGDLDAMIFNNIEVLHCERNQLVTLNICGYFLKALYAASNGMEQTTPKFLSWFWEFTQCRHLRLALIFLSLFSKISVKFC